jgi:hypothetical protein
MLKAEFSASLVARRRARGTTQDRRGDKALAEV